MINRAKQKMTGAGTESKEPENVWESQHKQYEKMLSDNGIKPKSQEEKNEQKPKRTLPKVKHEIPPPPKPEIPKLKPEIPKLKPEIPKLKPMLPKPKPGVASLAHFKPRSARVARNIRELMD